MSFGISLVLLKPPYCGINGAEFVDRNISEWEGCAVIAMFRKFDKILPEPPTSRAGQQYRGRVQVRDTPSSSSVTTTLSQVGRELQRGRNWDFN